MPTSQTLQLQNDGSLKQSKTTVLTCLRQFSGCGLTAAAQHVITANNNIILLFTPSAAGCGLLGTRHHHGVSFNCCAARKDLISNKEPESRLTKMWRSVGSDYVLDSTWTAKTRQDHHLSWSITWSWWSAHSHSLRINSTVAEEGNQNMCVNVRPQFNRWRLIYWSISLRFDSIEAARRLILLIMDESQRWWLLHTLPGQYLKTLCFRELSTESPNYLSFKF